MLSFLLSAFSGLSGLGAWIKGAVRYLCLHPMAAITLILAIVAGVEHHEAGKWAKVAEQRGNAMKAAVASAAQAKAIAEAKSKEASDYAEKFHTALDSAGPGLVAGYAASRRVPAACAAAPPGPQGDGAAVPLDAPAVPAVAVPESVLNICDSNYSYSLAAHEWAKQFETVN